MTHATAYFYTKDEMGMRMAYWFGFAAIAGAFGGLIAFGIQNVHASIANWRLLFIVEGIPSVFIGVLAMLLLPNRPEETTLFNEREREIALDRGSRGLKADTGRVVRKGKSIPAYPITVILMVGLRAHPCGVQGLEGAKPCSIMARLLVISSLADLCRRDPVFRCERSARVYLCVSAYHHCELRI